MTTDEKLTAILAAIQTDPGNRGLAELFDVCPDDFTAACHTLLDPPRQRIVIATGFYIASANPPAFETDGPLGAAFLARALHPLGIQVQLLAERPVQRALHAACPFVITEMEHAQLIDQKLLCLAIERGGPAADGRCRTMRGVDITQSLAAVNLIVEALQPKIGIGDGGNEIGMGKLPHELVARCIPEGDLIHCQVATTHLIVTGVSNWGAYALAAGVYVLRGLKPASELFDPEHERAILELMVRKGPLVDGVSGRQTATVDGLTWDEYMKPFLRIQQILEM